MYHFATIFKIGDNWCSANRTVPTFKLGEVNRKVPYIILSAMKEEDGGRRLYHVNKLLFMWRTIFKIHRIGINLFQIIGFSITDDSVFVFMNDFIRNNVNKYKKMRKLTCILSSLDCLFTFKRVIGIEHQVTELIGSVVFEKVGFVQKV